MTAMTSRWLRVYLQDHEAASHGGLALFRRVARGHGDRTVASEVAGLAAEVGTDQLALQGILAALDVPPSRPKGALMWLGEKLGRLKGNGSLLRRSPLTDVFELEALEVAVLAKLRGWRLLEQLVEHDPRLDADLLHELAARAERQAATLERLRLDTAVRVLGRRP